MLRFDSIVDKAGLYWGQSEFESWIDPDRQQQLLNREVHSWLSDLYWGEFLALRYARIRHQRAPDGRKRVWERISFDEMDHFAMLCQWFSSKHVLPQTPSRIIQRPLAMLQQFESHSESFLREAEETQVFLESLAHRLIDWRMKFICDSELLKIFVRIEKDEVFHIHATVFESKNGELDAESILSRNASKLFPIHLARGIVERTDLRRAHRLGMAVVNRHIIRRDSFHFNRDESRHLEMRAL